MLRALGAALVYLLMATAWVVAGLFMLIAPARFGNLVNESFGLFPAVRSRDWGKKLILRLAGVGLLAFAGRFLWGVYQLASGG